MHHVQTPGVHFRHHTANNKQIWQSILFFVEMIDSGRYASGA
jgi:hypothetical protein